MCIRDRPGQERGKETSIQAAVILKSVDGGVLSDHPEVEGRVTKGETEVDQQGALARLLGQRYGKIGGNGGDSAAAFGAEKHE